MSKQIAYDSTVFTAGPNINMEEFKPIENWDGRPASTWSVQKIGLFLSKVEKYTYQIYHSNRYGKHNLSKLIPGYILRQYANEAFGYNGWKLDVVQVEACERQPAPEIEGLSLEDTKYAILSEAQVKITLKDGTNTQAGGVGCATMSSRGESYGKAKKEAVNDALKKALLSFEKIIIEHDIKVESKYYVDGLYASEVKQKQKH